MHAAKIQDTEPTPQTLVPQLTVGQEVFCTHSILQRGKIVEIGEYTLVIAKRNGEPKTISKQFAITDKRAALAECENEARYWSSLAIGLQAEIEAEEEQANESE